MAGDAAQGPERPPDVHRSDLNQFGPVLPPAGRIGGPESKPSWSSRRADPIDCRKWASTSPSLLWILDKRRPNRFMSNRKLFSRTPVRDGSHRYYGSGPTPNSIPIPRISLHGDIRPMSNGSSTGWIPSRMEGMCSCATFDLLDKAVSRGEVHVQSRLVPS